MPTRRQGARVQSGVRQWRSATRRRGRSLSSRRRRSRWSSRARAQTCRAGCARTHLRSAARRRRRRPSGVGRRRSWRARNCCSRRRTRGWRTRRAIASRSRRRQRCCASDCVRRTCAKVRQQQTQWRPARQPRWAGRCTRSRGSCASCTRSTRWRSRRRGASWVRSSTRRRGARYTTSSVQDATRGARSPRGSHARKLLSRWPTPSRFAHTPTHTSCARSWRVPGRIHF
mmetsp:Transcript_4652/g.11235  ORF Transcript_4652/g.11235 Transcript_4652/m.11235 type:complete len:229 (+) Transcript_4652:236-922(+)